MSSSRFLRSLVNVFKDYTMVGNATKLFAAYGVNGTAKPVAPGNDSVQVVPCDNSTLGNVSSYVRCTSVPRDLGLLPREITFNDDNLVSVIAYSCLFIVAACGNLTVFITLFRNRNIKSRVNLFIMHLSIADLIVTFVMLPLETAWNVTVAWKAGEVACRILMFFRAFGLYLSSFTLVTISLDRYFAIMRPLSLNDADKRGKIMLVLAWVFSFVASIPQVRINKARSCTRMTNLQLTVVLFLNIKKQHTW